MEIKLTKKRPPELKGLKFKRYIIHKDVLYIKNSIYFLSKEKGSTLPYLIIKDFRGCSVEELRHELSKYTFGYNKIILSSDVFCSVASDKEFFEGALGLSTYHYDDVLLEVCKSKHITYWKERLLKDV